MKIPTPPVGAWKDMEVEFCTPKYKGLLLTAFCGTTWKGNACAPVSPPPPPPFPDAEIVKRPTNEL